MSHVSTRHRLATAAIAALAAAASTAAPAVASGPPAGCPAAATSNPFAPWGDSRDYQLAPGGDIEDGAASWSLSGGATAQEGNETFMVTSPTDHQSLRLPPSSTATSQRMCIGLEHPSFRFFVKRSGGSIFSRLIVDVVTDDLRGRERALTVGLLSGSNSWAPSAALPTVLNLFAPLKSNTMNVSFRFRPVGDAVWSIDDVYVDPYRTY